MNWKWLTVNCILSHKCEKLYLDCCFLRRNVVEGFEKLPLSGYHLICDVIEDISRPESMLIINEYGLHRYLVSESVTYRLLELEGKKYVY